MKGPPRRSAQSPELVAIDDRARAARHVVENAALDKRIHARMAEQNERRPVVVAACFGGLRY
jgi:hypothetical protein